jgi:hypothetical protein
MAGRAAAGLFFVAVACATLAAAAAPRVHVDWSGTASCAEQARIEAEVERLLASAAASSAERRVAARVEQVGPARYRLVLETTEAGNRFRRELEAASCEELTKPAALIIALSIDPQATARALTERQSEPAAAPPPADAPVETRAAPAPPPARDSAQLEPLPEPAVDAGVARPSEASKPDERFAPYVRPAVVFDSSVLPEPSTGPGIAIGVARSAWRLEAGAFYLPPRFGESENQVTKGGDISLVGGHVVSCFVPVTEPLELGPCLGMEAGTLHGEGVGVTSPASDDIGWLAARGGGRVAFGFGRSFAAILRADALARLGRAEFAIEGLGPVHRPGSVGLRLEAGIELGLP